MPAPEFTLELSGTAPDQEAQKGQLESGINAGFQSLWEEIQDSDAEIINAVTITLVGIGGTANNITANFPAPLGITEPVNGTRVSLRGVGTNDGPVTLSINGGQAFPVVDGRGRVLVGQEFTSATPIDLRFSTSGDGQWRVVSSTTHRRDQLNEAAARESADTIIQANVDYQRLRTRSIIDVDAIPFNGRMLIPTLLDFEGKVLEGQWEDNRQPWPPTGIYSQQLENPIFDIGSRKLYASEVGFNGQPSKGTWMDTGEPWDISGMYDGLVPATIEIINGRRVRIEARDFEGKAIFGFHLDNGEPWFAVGGGGGQPGISIPEMEVVITSGQINLYFHQYGNFYHHWPMVRDILPARNCDVWRTNGGREATRTGPGSYTDVRRWINDGEFEKSIRLKDRAEPIGGRQHGNEELTAFYVLMDGVRIDHTVPGVYRPKRIEMFQASDMLLPGATDETKYEPRGPLIMKASAYWDFRPGPELVYRHHVDHLVGGFVVNTAHFGMLPIQRMSLDGLVQITHSAAREPEWALEDVSQVDHAVVRTAADTAKIWGDRYAAEVRMTRGWTSGFRNFRFDNRPQYNKMYNDFFGGPGTYADGETTDVNVPWDTETIVRLNIKEASE